jgi:hypothetical protein
MKKHWADKVSPYGFWPVCWAWNSLPLSQMVFQKRRVTCKRCLKILAARGKK